MDNKHLNYMTDFNVCHQTGKSWLLSTAATDSTDGLPGNLEARGRTDSVSLSMEGAQELHNGVKA